MVKLNNKMRWTVSAIFALLILFGTYHAVFSIVAFIGMCLLLFVCERETILLQLFFVMPMANIFKMAPSSQSFFTIILLLYVVMHFVLPRNATLMIVLFVIYIVTGQLIAGGFLLLRTVKLICNFLFLSSILNDRVKIDNKKICFSYIIGNLVASCIGMMDSSFFRIKDYVGIIEVGGLEFADLTRFTGLHNDPNYYTVGLIVSLCLIVILYHKDMIKATIVASLSVPFVYFLIMTYSKSAILMISLPLVCLFYSLYKKKKIGSVLVIVLALVLVAVLVFSGVISIFDVVIKRIEQSETTDGTDLNTLTTGRWGLWVMYFKHLINDIGDSLFGHGINADLLNNKGSHNTYLDIFYYLGGIGAFLLFSIVFVILKQQKLLRIKRSVLNYSVLIAVLFLNFFLSGLFYYDIPFQLFFAMIVLNMDMNNRTEVRTI